MNDIDEREQHELSGLLTRPVGRRALLVAPAMAAGAAITDPLAAPLTLAAQRGPFPEFPNYAQPFVISRVEKSQELTVPLSATGPNDPNILVVYSGTLVGRLQGESSSRWTYGYFSRKIPTSRRWTDSSRRGRGWTLYADSTAMVALASVYNAHASNDAGWAVDASWLAIDRPSNDVGPQDEWLGIHGVVAVRDSDGFLNRLSYQATVLGRSLS